MGASIFLGNYGYKSTNPRPTNLLPVLKRQNMGEWKSLSNICQVTIRHDYWKKKYCSDRMFLLSLLFLVLIAGGVAYLTFAVPFAFLSVFSTNQVGTASEGAHDTSLVFRIRQQQMPQTNGNVNL
jgi:hypothetical protein